MEAFIVIALTIGICIAISKWNDRQAKVKTQNPKPVRQSVPQVDRYNPLIITGFILVFVPFFQLVGWILCGLGERQTWRTGERGCMLARWGRLIALPSILFWLMIIILFIVGVSIQI